MDGHERQKEQSRRMIEEALFSIMREKEYAQITISEIAGRADVARRTFYRLYDSREAVLDGYFRRLCREYRAQFVPLDHYDFARIAEEYFSFWYAYRDTLLLLSRRGLDYLAYRYIMEGAEKIVTVRAGREGDVWKYFPVYSAGGFAALLQLWINEGMRETPREYAKKVSREIRQVLPV